MRMWRGVGLVFDADTRSFTATRHRPQIYPYHFPMERFLYGFMVSALSPIQLPGAPGRRYMASSICPLATWFATIDATGTLGHDGRTTQPRTQRLSSLAVEVKKPALWPVFSFSRANFVRTAFFVDGYNLFYGLLAGTQYKWLDLPTLLQSRSACTVLPRNSRCFPRLCA